MLTVFLLLAPHEEVATGTARREGIKSRLMRYFGYSEVSATDVLNYVASIFARGDAKQ